MATPLLATPQDLALRVDLPEPELLLALKRASNRFRRAVHHPVHRVVNDQLKLNGNGRHTLHLKAIPADVHTVEVGGVTLVPDTDYQVDGDAGILRRVNGVWPEGLGTVRVVYSHGWEEIPGDIEDAVLELATTLALVHIHLQQNSAGSVQESYIAQATVGTTAAWTECVDTYRINVEDRA